MTSYTSQYKATGLFDLQRKQMLTDFSLDEARLAQLNTLITDLINVKIKRDPAVLSKNNNRLVALIKADLMKSILSNQQPIANSLPPPSQPGSSDPLEDEENSITNSIQRLVTDYVTTHASQNTQLKQTILSQLKELDSK